QPCWFEDHDNRKYFGFKAPYMFLILPASNFPILISRLALQSGTAQVLIRFYGFMQYKTVAPPTRSKKVVRPKFKHLTEMCFLTDIELRQIRLDAHHFLNIKTIPNKAVSACIA